MKIITQKCPHCCKFYSIGIDDFAPEGALLEMTVERLEYQVANCHRFFNKRTGKFYHNYDSHLSI